MILKQLPRILAISTLMGMSILAHADQALQELEGYVIDNAQAIVDAEENRQALQRELRQLREEKQQLKAIVEQLVTRLGNLTQELGRVKKEDIADNRSKADQAQNTANDARTKAIQAKKMASSALSTECRICFQEREGSSQCQGTRSSCSGWSSNPKWTSPFRDDTDNRGGGCQYQWKIECK
ncbi:MAG: hypothetical protein ABFS56_25495 [Pseudomonadota bacterium]